MSFDVSNLDIWSECADQISPVLLSGEVFRVVESQEKVATNELVDTLEEQALLEEMLDVTKPSVPSAAQDLSYLLFTPFRYPPLKYGSRFGQRFEPSLFYGSREIETTLAESAYYRLHFWFDMSEPPPAGKLNTQHTVFSVKIKTEKGLMLQASPFSKYESNLINKSSYSETQLLGKEMRENNIEAFEYFSARDNSKGINVGLFTANVFKEKKVSSTLSLLCSTHAEGVEFMDENSQVYNYCFIDFLDKGKFPQIVF